MTKVLLTCPPMIGQIDAFEDTFKQAGCYVHIPAFQQTLSVQELLEIVPSHDAWIIGDDPVTSDVIAAGAAGKLKAAVKWGVGVDNIDFASFKEHSIPISNTPGVFGREVADVAIGYVTGLARDLFGIDRAVRENGWPKPAGISLWNRKALVVGFGDIGQEASKRLLACDMTVSACDPAYKVGSLHKGVKIEEWPQAACDKDFIVFTCSLNPQTKHMLNSDLLTKLKDGVRIVNVARGPIVAEKALLAGLESGKIHSAALDVFEEEPLANDSPLRAFPKCIFGSHNASNTVDAVIHTSTVAIDKLFAFLRLQDRAK